MHKNTENYTQNYLQGNDYWRLIFKIIHFYSTGTFSHKYNLLLK